MIIKSDEIRKMIAALHTANLEDRALVYAACGFAYGRLVGKDDRYVSGYSETPKALEDIKKVVYKLNELAIVDTALLEKVMSNYLKTLNSDRKEFNVWKATSVLELFGLTKYISLAELENINNNYPKFMNLVAIFSDVFTQLSEGE